MKREEFIKRAEEIKRGWLDIHFRENIERILDSGIIDIENIPNNYHDVYPAIAAILEKVAISCIYGGSDGSSQRRKTNKIQKCIKFI